MSGRRKNKFRGSVFAAAAEAGAELTGYLEKQGRGIGRGVKWQRRYFQTVGHYLNYFEFADDADRAQKPRGSLDLNTIVPDGVEYSQGDQFVLAYISGRETKRMVLRASGEALAIRWVRGLMEKLRGASEGGDSLSAAALSAEFGGRVGGGDGYGDVGTGYSTAAPQAAPRVLRGPAPPPPPPLQRQGGASTPRGGGLGQLYYDPVAAQASAAQYYDVATGDVGAPVAMESYVSAVPQPLCLPRSPVSGSDALEPFSPVERVQSIHEYVERLEPSSDAGEGGVGSDVGSGSSGSRRASRGATLQFEGRMRSLPLLDPQLVSYALWPSDIMSALGLANTPQAPFLVPAAIECIGSTNDAREDAVVEYPRLLHFAPAPELGTGDAAVVDPAMVRPGAVYRVHMQDSRQQRVATVDSKLLAMVNKVFDEQRRLAIGEAGSGASSPRSSRSADVVPMAAVRAMVEQRAEMYKDATRQQHARFLEVTGDGDAALLAWADERIALHVTKIDEAVATLVAMYAAEDDEQFVSRLEFTVGEAWWTTSSLNPYQLALF